MKKTLITEIKNIRRVMGLNENEMPEFMLSQNLFKEASPAPAQPDYTPDVDTPTRTSPNKPGRQHPFKPNPIVKPKPKAMMEDETTCPCGEQLDEAKQKYDTYHETFSSAVQDARRMAEEAGYTVNEDDWQHEITFGPGRPKNNQTFRASIGLFRDGKPQKKALTIVVYDRGTQTNNYELTTYIW